MKISLLTVSFNSATTISDTINSIRSQDHKDIEYIIVDGNSKKLTRCPTPLRCRTPFPFQV